MLKTEKEKFNVTRHQKKKKKSKNTTKLQFKYKVHTKFDIP